MTSCRFTTTRNDDDMADYQLPEDVEDKDLVKDWHEPVQINLGPNVGDITTRRKSAYLGRVNFISGVNRWRPKACSRLEHVAVNRPDVWLVL